MSVIIKSGASSDLLTVNANKQAAVNLPTTVALQPGFADLAYELTDGSAPLSGMSAVERASRPLNASQQGHLSVGQDTILFYDNFNHATVNTSSYRSVNTSMTNGLSGGFLVLNSGSSVTGGQGTQVATYRTFSYGGDSALQVDHWIQFLQPAQTNNVSEWGLGFTSGVATPTDGIFFRLTNTGTLECVLNYNSVETTVAVSGATFSAGDTYHTSISISSDEVQFFVNGALVTSPILRGSSGANPSFSVMLPLFARTYNSNTTSLAQQFKIAGWQVTARDFAVAKPWNESMSGSCLGSYTTPPGVVTATNTSNYANSAAPANATLSNTSLGYTTLGGQWQAVMVAGAETDYGLFGYQNPPGSATIPGRNLYINYVRIGETFNTVAANAATPITLQWGVGIGSTSTSLAAADSATAGTRSARRVAIGGQQFASGALVGTMSPGFSFEFKPPALVEPGTYVHTILKITSGTATGNNIRGTVSFSGNWEC